MQMEKKNYERPEMRLVEVDSKCMFGNESGPGTDASLDLEFEEVSENPEE